MSVLRAVLAACLGMLVGCQHLPNEAPASIESGYVQVSGGRIFYEASGSGEVVILSHGGFGDRRMWDAQFAAFARDFRVVRYDHRGFGRSTAPIERYSPVSDLLALMDSLDIPRAHLVGNSMGGSLALDFVLSHPDRVGRVVVVANGANGYPFEGPDVDYSNAAFREAAQNGVESAAEIWLAHPMIAMTRADPRASSLVATMIRENSSIFRMRYWPVEGLSPSAFARLGEVRTPVLFVVGDRDAASIRDGARASAERIPGAVVISIRDGDHLVQMTEPEAFNRSVRAFLQ